MVPRSLVTFVAGALVSLGASAQLDVQDRRIYPDALRDDFRLLRQTLEATHPDPYRYRTKAEMDLLFQAADTALSRPITAEAFIRAVLPVLKAMGDANTELLPPADLATAYAHTEPMIPMLPRIIDGDLYADRELKGFRSIPAGSRILRINGRTSSSILARMRALLVPEGADTTRLDRRIEQDFPVLYRRAVERADRFEVEFETPAGTSDTKIMMAMTRDEMAGSGTRQVLALAPWRMEESLSTHTAWLTLSSFNAAALTAAKIDPGKFLASLGKTLRKGGPSTLVIDLRGTGGEDLGLAVKVFALIAQAPYRPVRGISVRSTHVPDPSQYTEPAPDSYAALNVDFEPESNGRMNMKPDDPRLHLIAPSDKAFQGEVYIVCDGLTTDAAASLVMMAKRSGRARVVGEETGTNATSWCGGLSMQVVLPGTGCVLRLPLMRFVPDGDAKAAADRGELPDHAVGQLPQDLAQGVDSVRRALLELIAEKR